MRLALWSHHHPAADSADENVELAHHVTPPSDIGSFYSREELDNESPIICDRGVLGSVGNDVGKLELEAPPHLATPRPPDRQSACEEILSIVWRDAVTRGELSFAPQWLPDEALEA